MNSGQQKKYNLFLEQKKCKMQHIKTFLSKNRNNKEVYSS